MIKSVLFSDCIAPFDWSEAVSNKLQYGPKGALLAALPRAWTLPFVLIPSSVLNEKQSLSSLGSDVFARIRSLASEGERLIVRSSVLGESVWDRGTYTSVELDASMTGFDARLIEAAQRVRESAKGRATGLVVQRFLAPRLWGEFGNLLRISKTRDQWELSVLSQSTTSRVRFNTQRDEAAPPDRPLLARPRHTTERLFASVAAWFNSYLLRGRGQRLTCEWIASQRQFFLVQLDEEDEDVSGVNPFQISVSIAHTPKAASGKYFTQGAINDDATQTWDKLKVLHELWEPHEAHKPLLFYACLARLPPASDRNVLTDLINDFRALIGSDNIVVRTSGRANDEKVLNLPRTECVSPEEAAAWCIRTRDKFVENGVDVNDRVFVAHRFIGSRASAWARAAPGNPVVEIHSLWGLPDALQYCPFDIWEVHVPTEVATEYAEYKSNILIPRENGGWDYVRVKNELARNFSIGRREAINVAQRSAAIAKRLGKPCHIMWFIGCLDEEERQFNIPWYWTEAEDAEKNIDRSNYRVTEVYDWESLSAFTSRREERARQAIELRPTDQMLMRDNSFIAAVGKAAAQIGVPVILSGSPQAHAYYQLRRQGCAIVTPGEKEHSRIRRVANFGKLVRDKIPGRIARRQEAEITRSVPEKVLKGFLISKILEEALEVRNAENRDAKAMELADLYEVLRALAKLDEMSMEEVAATAEDKRESAGGFDQGLVLLQTGILGRAREEIYDPNKLPTQVLARRLSDDTLEIPFSFFGFMEMEQPRSFVFYEYGIRLDVTLKGDRIELRISKEAEQLELPLESTVIESGELN